MPRWLSSSVYTPLYDPVSLEVVHLHTSVHPCIPSKSYTGLSLSLSTPGTYALMYPCILQPDSLRCYEPIYPCIPSYLPHTTWHPGVPVSDSIRAYRSDIYCSIDRWNQQAPRQYPHGNHDGNLIKPLLRPCNTLMAPLGYTMRDTCWTPFAPPRYLYVPLSNP